MGELVSYAERELELANCEEPERTAILKMVETFADVSDSAGQAGAIISILEKLLRFQPLTPLTSDPSDWNQVAGPTNEFPNAEELWQSRRCPTTFSRDGGKTWYDIDDPSRNNGDVHDRDSGRWVDAYLGHNLRVGVVVRVRLGAYTRGAAAAVNGVSGRVTAVRHGMVAVMHDNGQGFNHEPDVLQVLAT